MFFYTESENGIISYDLQGYQDYLIYKDIETGAWTWVDKKEGSTIASLKNSRFPFGRQVWQLSKPLCDSEARTKTLLITICKSHQFSCDDGSCIPIEKRCNFFYDCKDNSDENNCIIYKLSDDYEVKVSSKKTKNILSIFHR